MKKVVVVILSMVLVALLAGCPKAEGPNLDNKFDKIEASIKDLGVAIILLRDQRDAYQRLAGVEASMLSEFIDGENKFSVVKKYRDEYNAAATAVASANEAMEAYRQKSEVKPKLTTQ